MCKRWRLYEVSVGRSGQVSTSLYSSTTASKARAAAWRDYADCWDVSFGDFVKIASVRAYSGAPPTSCYDYIRRNYGLSVAIGDRVVLRNEGDFSGIEGEVIYPGSPSTAHVHVALVGQRFPAIVHPMNIELVREAA